MTRMVNVLATVIAVVMAGSAIPAAAQDAGRFELFVGYGNLQSQRVTNADVATVNGLTPSQVRTILGADITTASGRAGLNGFNATVTGFLNDRFGVSGDVSISGKTEDAVFFGLPGSDRTRVYQFLAGPHVAIRNGSRITPFARALFGAARFDASYRNPVAIVEDKQTVFSMAIGGGVDVRAGRRVSVRALQIDYNPLLLRSRATRDTTGVPFDLKSVRRDNMRLSFGIVIR